MYAQTPASTQFFEELTRQPIFQRVIDQDLRKEPFFQSHDINRMPFTTQQRVSEKLRENRLRRIQISMQKQQEVESMFERKKMKEKEIQINLRNRFDKANKKKQKNLRQSCSQQQNRKKGQDMQSTQKLLKFQANLLKIEKGREKAEEKKNQYIFRIHRRNEEHLRKAKARRQMMLSIQQAENDQIHMEEWNHYRQNLMRKYQGREKSPPDHLYKVFKQRNLQIKNTMSQSVKRLPLQSETKKEEQSKQTAIVSIVSSKLLVSRTKKAEYFGIHEQNMEKKTMKELQKMRRFLQNEGNAQSFVQNEEVFSNFKYFFYKEIHKK